MDGSAATMLLWGSLLVVFLVVILFIRQKNPPPIHGVYQQPGKWYPLKCFIFFVILKLRQWQNICGIHLGKKQAGYGMQSHASAAEMDAAQPLSRDAKAFDAVFFIAANEDGYYFVAGAERRHHGVINGLCYIVVPGKGLLCSHKLPDTVLFGAKNEEYGAEGLMLKPVQAMKKWKLTYKGKMW